MAKGISGGVGIPASRGYVTVQTLLAAALSCVFLWFPSAAVGVAVFRAAGEHTYLTLRGLALPSLVSLALVVIPIFILGRDAEFHRRRGVIAAGVIVVIWQFAWAGIALVTDNPELIAWPSYAQPAEPEPWNPAAVFATGLAIVGVAAGVLTFLAVRTKSS